MIGRLRQSLQENRVNRFMQKGETMMRMGRHEQALQLHEKALEISRELASAQPEDQLHNRVIASLLYNIASSLLAIGRLKEAIEALEESEQKYLKVGASGLEATDTLLADVQARKGMTKCACGYGASAVVDLNLAVTGYTSLFSGREDDPLYLDLARVLSLNALVLKKWGDPDLAVASADFAIRAYLSRAGEINGTASSALHASYLRMAAGVASEIHAAHGRMNLALSADTFAVHTARSLMPRQTVSDLQELALAVTRAGLHLRDSNRREEAEPLLREGRALDAATTQIAISQWERVKDGIDPIMLTVATSLTAAAKELGSDRVPDKLSSSLTCPAIEIKILTPWQRCDLRLAPTFAKQLADAAIALPAAMRGVMVRLGLEAHYLFVMADLFQNPESRHQLIDFGPSWARILLACSREYEAEGPGQLGMGLDLARWAGMVAMKLMQIGELKPDLVALIRDCLEQHGRLLIASGDEHAGKDILALAHKL
ncbi:MAG: tetratricopeptide repeat protein [Blastocatellia bacterium]|nr:tetratricopeptide repeat protein [Blastocatellia bacterium]